MVDKLKIFISHIHEEAALGLELKASLEDGFAERIEVFVSSDVQSNPGGQDVLPRIRAEMKDPNCRMLISLLSPQSFREPWISIELGAAWILGHSVFPLCHIGQSIDGLGRPMKDFGGASLVDDDAAARLIGAVEMATKMNVPKGWSRPEFLSRMRGASSKSKSAPISAVAAAPTGKGSGKSDEEIKILQVLASAKNQGRNDLRESELIRISGIRPAEFTHYIYQLCDDELVTPMAMVDEMEYCLAPAGSHYLIKNKLMP